MKTSPRRPLILKRRKVPLPVQNASGETSKEGPKRPPAQQEPSQAQASTKATESNSCKFPAGIKIIDHPTMPNTQVVAIPNNADLNSIIAALTARGKESGSSGPNKFILISCGGSSAHPGRPQPPAQASSDAQRTEVPADTPGPKPVARDVNVPRSPGTLPRLKQESCAGGEAAGYALENSLTNIQWLGKMSSDSLGSCNIKQEMQEKENCHLEQSQVKVEEPTGAPPSWRDSVAERPPYSYMAMIQFAINSTERKRMTLKDIYTWIEDHFPYFKHIAKPGWKNSIRHNLSLHDMFVRETSANGKVSFWTIHPSANRCLTLDQVFKQQKRPNPEFRRNVTIKTELPLGTRRKMKPLLPRVSSYLVPIQFPVSQSLVLQPSVKVPLPLAASLMSSELVRHSKRVRIAPKKQHLRAPRGDEPELVFAEPPEPQPADGGPFQTPVKETLPISSTPSKSAPLPSTPEAWRLASPAAKVGELEVSPVRTPRGTCGPPPDSLGLVELSCTPPKSLPLFGSPRELLDAQPLELTPDPFGSPAPPHPDVPRPASPEPQVPNLAASRSLTEGLVLDTMNDSLSKILLDISFPGLDEDPLGADNINWSQFIPE
uniref:Forkhead box protein M1 n=1 Tax=Jaculus jaculus TaxID=51337 RepID=A0A8C5KBP5_JACJA